MKSHEFRAVLHAQPFCPFSFYHRRRRRPTRSTPPRTPGTAPDGDVVAVSAPGGVVLVGIEWIMRVAFTPYPPGVTGQSERLRDLKRADPFVAFEIELADGRRFVVESADHIMVPRKGSTVVVADPDGLALLDSDQITEIDLIVEPPGREARVERLRKLKRADPFVPFVMHLADGRRLPVAAADRMTISPDDGTVCSLRRGGGFDILQADEITYMEPGPGAAAATRS